MIHLYIVMVGLRSSHSFFYDARDNLTRLPDRLIFLVTLRKLEPPPLLNSRFLVDPLNPIVHNLFLCPYQFKPSVKFKP
jgi:hypothetical protein